MESESDYYEPLDDDILAFNAANGLVAFDDDFDDDDDENLFEVDDSDFDGNVYVNNNYMLEPLTGTLPSSDIENRNLLESIAPYIGVKELRALGRTSKPVRRELNKVRNNELMWKTKVERLIGFSIPQDITYNDWRYVYDIIADKNPRQLLNLESPSIARLGIMLGADPSAYWNSSLRKAIADDNLPMIAVLLTDPKVDSKGILMLEYLNSLVKEPAMYRKVKDIIDSR